MGGKNGVPITEKFANQKGMEEKDIHQGSLVGTDQ